jgi:hypothetical protein
MVSSCLNKISSPWIASRKFQTCPTFWQTKMILCDPNPKQMHNSNLVTVTVNPTKVCWKAWFSILSRLYFLLVLCRRLFPLLNRTCNQFFSVSYPSCRMFQFHRIQVLAVSNCIRCWPFRVHKSTTSMWNSKKLKANPTVNDSTAMQYSNTFIIADFPTVPCSFCNHLLLTLVANVAFDMVTNILAGAVVDRLL